MTSPRVPLNPSQNIRSPWQDLDGNGSSDTVTTASTTDTRAVPSEEHEGVQDLVSTSTEEEVTTYTGFATEEEANDARRTRLEQIRARESSLAGYMGLIEPYDLDGNGTEDTVEYNSTVDGSVERQDDGSYNLTTTVSREMTTTLYGAPEDMPEGMPVTQLPGSESPEGDALGADEWANYQQNGTYTPWQEGLAVQEGVSGPEIADYQRDLRQSLTGFGLDDENVTRLLGDGGMDQDGVDGYYGPRTASTNNLNDDITALTEAGLGIDYDGLNAHIADESFDPASANSLSIGDFVSDYGDYEPGSVLELPGGQRITVPMPDEASGDEMPGDEMPGDDMPAFQPGWDGYQLVNFDGPSEFAPGSYPGLTTQMTNPDFMFDPGGAPMRSPENFDQAFMQWLYQGNYDLSNPSGPSSSDELIYA